MNDEQKAVLIDVRDGLRHLAETTNDIDLSTDIDVSKRAILKTQIFLLTQKVRYLLGENDE